MHSTPIYASVPIANWPCPATQTYACTTGGYAGQNTWGYGGNNASYDSAGRAHNCTLYAAFKMAGLNVKQPTWSGDASTWANKAFAAGTPVDQTPAVGAIAQWNRGSAGHVAYVESVDPGGAGIVITEDNYYLAQPYPGGYTAKIHITRSSPAWPDNFIHFGANKAPTQPGQPSASQSGTSTTINLAWPSVAGATKYHYQWSKDGGASFKSGSTGSGTSATFTGTYGRRYIFQVQGGNAAGWGAYSAYSNPVTLKRTPPGQPGQPSASQSGTSTTINLAWPSVAGATNYHYQWSKDGGASFKSGSTGSGTSATFTGTYGRRYIFQVQGGNAAGWGAYSAYSNPVTLNGTPPGQPGQPSASQSGTSTTINLAWPSVAGATNYHYQWSKDGGASFKSGSTGSGTSATFTGTYGRRYIFQVQAGNAAGWGAYSAYSNPVTLNG